jgi:hypothetical protein
MHPLHHTLSILSFVTHGQKKKMEKKRAFEEELDRMLGSEQALKVAC